jgi:hypothetical protein
MESQKVEGYNNNLESTSVNVQKHFELGIIIVMPQRIAATLYRRNMVCG